MKGGGGQRGALASVTDGRGGRPSGHHLLVVAAEGVDDPVDHQARGQTEAHADGRGLDLVALLVPGGLLTRRVRLGHVTAVVADAVTDEAAAEGGGNRDTSVDPRLVVVGLGGGDDAGAGEGGGDAGVGGGRVELDVRPRGHVARADRHRPGKWGARLEGVVDDAESRHLGAPGGPIQDDPAGLCARNLVDRRAGAAKPLLQLDDLDLEGRNLSLDRRRVGVRALLELGEPPVRIAELLVEAADAGVHGAHTREGQARVALERLERVRGRTHRRVGTAAAFTGDRVVGANAQERQDDDQGGGGDVATGRIHRLHLQTPKTSSRQLIGPAELRCPVRGQGRPYLRCPTTDCSEKKLYTKKFYSLSNPYIFT